MLLDIFATLLLLSILICCFIAAATDTTPDQEIGWLVTSLYGIVALISILAIWT